MRVLVSGKTFEACLDPGATEFYNDHPDVKMPELVDRGSGYRADFGQVEDDPLWFLLEHMYNYADLFLGGGSDAYTASQGRAILKDWQRLATQCEPSAHGYYTDDFSSGWYHDDDGWHIARRLTGRPGDKDRTPFPDGSERSAPRQWLHVARWLPLTFVAATHPDDTWRKVR